MKKAQRKSVVLWGTLILREETKGQCLPIPKEESTRDNCNSIDRNLNAEEKHKSMAFYKHNSRATTC